MADNTHPDDKTCPDCGRTYHSGHIDCSCDQSHPDGPCGQPQPTEPAAGYEHEWGERLPTEFQPCAHPYDTDCDARQFPRSGTVYVPESAPADGHACSSEDCACYHRGIIAEHEGRASLTLYRRGATPADTEPILIDKRFPCGCHVAMTVLPDGTIQGGGFSHHEAVGTEIIE